VRDSRTAEFELDGTDFTLLVATDLNSEPDQSYPFGFVLQLLQVGNDISKHGWIACPTSAATYAENPGGLYGREIEPHRLDWSIVNQWLHRCRSKHSCVSGSSEPQTLQGLRVIDCTSRRIVDAPPHCEYAALSYVWGSEAGTVSQAAVSHLSMAPLTIEDAIVCTRALGLFYLWVDRYCILQDDTKHTIIQNMDKIYEDAAITIIDAAGSSAHSGLAGVSRTSRRLQHSVEVHGRRFSVVSNVKSEVNNSKWASRGWTYQEGLCSRRRLVFAPSQVYFQCLEMHCCESLTAYVKLMPPWAAWAGDALSTPSTNLQVFPFRSKEPGEYKTDAVDFSYCLKEYLRRDLTYESDTLNAFAGVMRQLWKSRDHDWNLCGLPIPSDRLLKALLWLPEYDARENKITRRNMFPSWSWAGLKGITGIRESDCIWPDSRFDVSVTVEDTSGSLTTIDSVSSLRDDCEFTQFRPVIYLTGWTTNVRFSPKPHANGGEIGVVRVMRQDSQCCLTQASIIRACVPDHFASDPSLLFKSAWLVFLLIRKDGGVTGLVLNHVEGQSYSRLGVLDRAFCQPITKLDEDGARLRKRDWDPSVWLDCKRQTIHLV